MNEPIKTPATRTEQFAASRKWEDFDGWDGFARQLETELNEAKEQFRKLQIERNQEIAAKLKLESQIE